MGYTTDFTGSFSLSRPATAVEKEFINKLADTRRMKRDVNKLMELYNGKHGLPFVYKPTEEQQRLMQELALTGVFVEIKSVVDNRTPEEIYGYMGEYFVGGDGFKGQDSDSSVIDHNAASGEIGWNDHKGDQATKERLLAELKEGKVKQPSLWMQWVLNEDGTELAWDGGEKFYSYIEWLKYLIDHFFEPWGIKLNGEVTWSGEESGDIGKIEVKDNVIQVYEGVSEYKYLRTL